MAQVISVTWEKDGNDFIQVYKTRYTKEEMKNFKKSLQIRKQQIQEVDNDLVKINAIIG